jgi:hypothetical protein
VKFCLISPLSRNNPYEISMWFCQLSGQVAQRAGV